MQHDDNEQATVLVWDPLVRIFHWALASFFFIAWLTGEEWGYLHEWSGYTVAALVAFRIVWGLIGTPYARFRSFIFAPGKVLEYLRGLADGSAAKLHYLGHNPAGGAMAIALLLCSAGLAVTGMALAGGEGHGPLAATALASLDEHQLEEIHEAFANFALLLVVAHVLGVAASSLRHRENLVLSMFTGRKRDVQDQREDAA